MQVGVLPEGEVRDGQVQPGMYNGLSVVSSCMADTTKLDIKDCSKTNAECT